MVSRTAIRRLSLALCAALLSAASWAPAHAAAPARAVAGSNGGCALPSLAPGVQHVVMLAFDNVHLSRDNPDVPSDLEQMPNLLNLFTSYGVMSTGHHTPLLAYTATDFLTSLTGNYPSRHGLSFGNTARTFEPDGSSRHTSSFGYWTAPVHDVANDPGNTSYNLVSETGANAPAPWVPFTRAGCNVGAAGTANIILENEQLDVAQVFGEDSPENADPQRFQHYVGIGVHCAQDDALCAGPAGHSDLLPDEPGGYDGYRALYGHQKIVDATGDPIHDINGNLITGFPGFGGLTPVRTLGYLSYMLEHSVPVVYGYMSSLHFNSSPGESSYETALHTANDAFGTFLDRLAADGITPDNTIFSVTTDEGDHFLSGPPNNPGCTGEPGNLCNYTGVTQGANGIESRGALQIQQGITTPFEMHAASAPVFYITGNPGRSNPVTRNFARALGKLRATDVYSGQNQEWTHYLADSVELDMLHMLTRGDPLRRPTLVDFALPQYFVFATDPPCDGTPAHPCQTLEPSDKWNHGDVDPVIDNIFLGLAGPGVKHLGLSDSVWSDHADLRPTLMFLLGLRDDYVHDGRALFEFVDESVIPERISSRLHQLIELGETLKSIDAPLGDLSLFSLGVSTTAVRSNSSFVYNTLEALLAVTTQARNVLAGVLIAVLEDAAFGGGDSPGGGARAAASTSGGASLATAAQADSLAAQGRGLIGKLQKDSKAGGG